MNRQSKENHAILQLGLIVGSYALGYIPMAGTLSMGRRLEKYYLFCYTSFLS